MNPLPALTDQERAKVRKDLFEEKKRDFFFMVEVVGESTDWHGRYVLNDFVSMGELLDRQLWRYLEKTGMFQKAEEEVLSSKAVNGKRYLTA